MPHAETDLRGSLGTVRNAVTLLHLLGEGPALQHLTDLAERSGMSVPTVHRLLRSLVLADLAVQDPRTSRYGLGPELVRLSHRYLARLPILGALGPYLAQLRDGARATIEVHTIVRGMLTVLDRIDGPDAGPYRDAHAVTEPLTSPAGRLILARSDDETWAAALRDLDPAEREQTEGSRSDWASAAYLLMPGDTFGGPTRIAVPLTTEPDDNLTTLTALVPSERAGEAEQIAGQLARAGSAAMRTLGHV